MPKTPSAKLFRLIKSLSGSEKRYFKLFVQNGNGTTNKYLLLFDAIDAQETFDESALKQIIYDKKTLSSRKYSELKSYLYELILKALQAYDEKSSVDYQLKSLLLSVRSLYKRSLFDDCYVLLRKAKKLATRYEEFATLLEIQDWEKRIAYAQTDIDFLSSAIDQIEKDESTELDFLQEIVAMRTLFFKLLCHLRTSASLRRGGEREELEKRLQHLLQEEAHYRSHPFVKLQIVYYRTVSLYFYAKGNFEEFFRCGKYVTQLFENKADLLQEDPSEYISTLSNVVVSCILLNRYEDAHVYLQKIKEVRPATLDDRLKIHRQYYTSKFRLSIDTGNFEEGVQDLEEHFVEIKKFDATLFEGSSFYFQHFYIYFGAERYEDALHYLNLWLNRPRSNERQDLQAIARILQLLIHYEIGNMLLLESIIRSTYRYLKSHNSLFAAERRILAFMQKASKTHVEADLEQPLLRLREELQQLAQQPKEKAMLRLFDIDAWLESKISKQTFAEIIRQKYEQAKAAR